MSAHRAPGQHRARPGSRRKGGLRWGRLVLTAMAVATCVVAVVAGISYLPTASEASPGAASVGAAADQVQPFALEPDDLLADDGDVSRSGDRALVEEETEAPGAAADDALPASSGTGRRVVFSEGLQRVWLVGPGGRVLRTYPVSGSVYDNLFPGTYQVFSRSRHAVGIDDSGTMEYFVRFTHGTGGSAIGFHTIPVADGERVQTIGQLGTPLSHGCIRQATNDAVAMWEFAEVGTPVVVTP